jgi:thioredoxin 1
MYNKAISAAIVIVVFIIGCVRNIDPLLEYPEIPQEVVMLDSDNFSELTAIPRRIAMVDFYSPTCPPCQKMDSIVTHLYVRYKDRALVGKVNVLTDDTLKHAFFVQWTPTFLFFSGGQEIRRVVGMRNEDSLAVIIDSLLGSVTH